MRLVRFPILEQLRTYGRADAQGDLSAGLTVAVMLIPQGMAYALIAGLPPIYGLYASLVPLAVYAFFGTSRQLSVAPVAIVALLTAAGVAPLADGDPQRYVHLAIGLALMVGVLQLVLGLARFGFLTNFLSHPVLAGFTSAAALIIGFSQLKYLLGVALPRSHYIHEILWSAVQEAGNIHVPTLAIGLGGIAILVGLRRVSRAIPGALAAVAVSTVVVWAWDLHEAGVQIVGDVPRGLPAPILPGLSLADVRSLLPSALVISLVGFMESFAVAKVYASRNRYSVDANQELIALGLANVAGAFFRSFPTTGGFSRTAVNAESGARSQIAGLISAVIIGLTLLLLTPVFYYLPSAILAAIVMVAVAGLLDWKEARFLWRVDRRDFAMMMLTFAATLLLGIEIGILVGITAALIVVIHRSSRPHVAIEGRLPGSSTYRNVARNPQAETRDGIVVFRMDDSLYFANAEYFKESIEQLEQREQRLGAVVLNAFPINRIDSTAVHALKGLVEDLQGRNVELVVAGLKGPVRDVLEKAGLLDVIGRDRFFLEVHDAVSEAERTLRKRGEDGSPTDLGRLRQSAPNRP